MTLIESNPFGRAIQTRRVAGFEVSPLMVTWDLVVLRVCSEKDEIVLSIPGRNLDQVLDQLDAGELDDLLVDAMAARGSLGTLSDTQNPSGQPAVHDRIADAKNLVRPERDTLTGRIGGPGQGGREAKHSSGQGHPLPKPSRPGLPWKPIAAIAAAVVLVVVIAAVVLSSSDDTAGDETALVTDPVEPVDPSVFSQDEADSLQGTYDLTRTVIDGNPSNPLGTVDSATFTLTTECDGSECSLTADGGLGPAVRSESGIQFVIELADVCISDPSITDAVAVQTVDLEVVGPDRLVGQASLENTDTGSCPNVNVDNVVFRWEAVRRPSAGGEPSLAADGAAAEVAVVPDFVDESVLSLQQCAGQTPIPPFTVSIENVGDDETTFDVVLRQGSIELSRQGGISLVPGASAEVDIEVALRSFDPIEVEAVESGSSEVAGADVVELNGGC